eukprot:g4492.t1
MCIGCSAEVEALPHLCLGDVVRVHRAKIKAKLPRFMNIEPQRHSAIVAFPCPNQLLDEATDASGQSHNRALQGAEHTIVEADKSRARSLQVWIQKRLSKETMSQYLVMIQELLGTSAQRDLVVKVLAVQASPPCLVVSDGSVPSVSVDVSEPVLAARYLLSDAFCLR